MSNLPPLADAMYRVWWQLAQDTADEGFDTGKFTLSVPQSSEVASIANRDVYGGAGGYNPIGWSQLFSRARQISRASLNLTSADDSAVIDSSMIALAPYARSDADRAAMPAWEIKASFTYQDPEGQVIQDWITLDSPRQLPYTVGTLRARAALDIQDALNRPPPSGTPRSGQLLSIDRLSITEV